MLNNKWLIGILILVVIVGIIVITKANFGGHVGMAGEKAAVEVGPDAK